MGKYASIIETLKSRAEGGLLTGHPSPKPRVQEAVGDESYLRLLFLLRKGINSCTGQALGSNKTKRIDGRDKATYNLSASTWMVYHRR